MNRWINKMSMAIGAICGFVALLWSVIILATKYGSRAAQVDALKAEIKRNAEEQENANKIHARVRAMSDDDVRNRLRNL